MVRQKLDYDGLAKLTGLTRSGIYKIATGSRWPSPDNLDRILKGMNLQPGALFGGVPARAVEPLEALDVIRSALLAPQKDALKPSGRENERRSHKPGGDDSNYLHHLGMTVPISAPRASGSGALLEQAGNGYPQGDRANVGNHVGQESREAEAVHKNEMTSPAHTPSSAPAGETSGTRSDTPKPYRGVRGGPASPEAGGEIEDMARRIRLLSPEARRVISRSIDDLLPQSTSADESKGPGQA